MFIFLTNKAVLSELSPELKQAIKQELTITNPLLKVKEHLGLSLFGMVPELRYYEDTTKTGLIIPIGALPKAIELAELHGVSVSKEQISDQRTTSNQSKFFSNLKFTGTLRPYQQDIVDACLPKTVGVVEAMTGSGKTITFVALTLEKQESTLILVNTIELANQTKKAFLKFTNINEEDIGFVGDGKFELKPITVALHQSMAKMDDPLFSLLSENFGMIIADEVHICSAETYYKTMTKLSAKYKFGFSATPERDDGLTKAIFWATGPHIHKVPPITLENVLVKPTVRFIETEYEYPLMSTQEYQDMLSDMAEDLDRNQLILDTLENDYEGRYVCMLCARVAQVYFLYNALGPNRAVFLVSKMPKKKRKEAMERILNKDVNIVISTYGLFSTGIDVPHLDVGMLCAPIKSKVKLTQTAGRIMRKSDGKVGAELVDFYDPRVGLLKAQHYQRRRIFKRITEQSE